MSSAGVLALFGYCLLGCGVVMLGASVLMGRRHNYDAAVPLGYGASAVCAFACLSLLAAAVGYSS